VLSRLQLPANLVAGLTPPSEGDSEAAPAIVLYLGCNVLKTPHIVLLCLEVLTRPGTRYKVFAGAAYCCGVIQYRPATPKRPDELAAIRWQDLPALALHACSAGVRRAISNSAK